MKKFSLLFDISTLSTISLCYLYYFYHLLIVLALRTLLLLYCVGSYLYAISILTLLTYSFYLYYPFLLLRRRTHIYKSIATLGTPILSLHSRVYAYAALQVYTYILSAASLRNITISTRYPQLHTITIYIHIGGSIRIFFLLFLHRWTNLAIRRNHFQ